MQNEKQNTNPQKKTNNICQLLKNFKITKI